MDFGGDDFIGSGLSVGSLFISDVLLLRLCIIVGKREGTRVVVVMEYPRIFSAA